jgi:hypothetical protein
MQPYNASQLEDIPNIGISIASDLRAVAKPETVH